MTTPATWGNPFGVTTTKGLQYDMKIAAFADGSFVAVWVDGSDGDTSGDNLRGQIFNADGSKRGIEFAVNNTTAYDQKEPVITVLNDGRFVVAWTDGSGIEDASALGIRARIFNPDGSAFNRTGAVGGDGDFQVNTTSQAGTQWKPSIAALANGGFVITFEDLGSKQIKAQVFDTQGLSSGPEVQASLNPGAFSSSSVVASGNGYTVIHTSRITDYPTNYGRTFYTDGRAPSDEFLVSNPETTSFSPHSTKLSDGRFVIVWGTWVSDETGGFGSHKAQIYNADGSEYGREIAIGDLGVSDPNVFGVTALLDGGFAFVFASEDLDDDEIFNIGVAFFDANGNRTGINSNIGQAPQSTDLNFGISTLADGRVVVTSFVQKDVFGQIVDGRAAGISLPGTNGNDEYYGTAFNDSLNGAAGNDKLVGEAGDDILNGGTGHDTLIGGLGNDTYHVDNVGDQVIELAGGGIDNVVSSISYTLSTELENLTGSGPAALWLTGNAMANTITGTGGDDTLDGGAGADIMIGGLGNDTYHVDRASDQVTELAGSGIDTVISSVSLTLGAHVENLIGSGSGALTLTGNGLANAITGTSGKNRINGGTGNDTLNGGTGNDVLIGGKGKDAFVFASKLGTSKTDRKVNFDTISDFKLKEDKIHLDNAVFTKLKKTGKLNKKFFSLDKAKDKNDYIIYDRKTGVLSYDLDGSGGKKAIEFAKVKAKLNLAASDFIVI